MDNEKETKAGLFAFIQSINITDILYYFPHTIITPHLITLGYKYVSEYIFLLFPYSFSTDTYPMHFTFITDTEVANSVRTCPFPALFHCLPTHTLLLTLQFYICQHF